MRLYNRKGGQGYVIKSHERNWNSFNRCTKQGHKNQLCVCENRLDAIE